LILSHPFTCLTISLLPLSTSLSFILTRFLHHYSVPLSLCFLFPIFHSNPFYSYLSVLSFFSLYLAMAEDGSFYVLAVAHWIFPEHYRNWLLLMCRCFICLLVNKNWQISPLRHFIYYSGS
jgi:hypothetical protein